MPAIVTPPQTESDQRTELSPVRKPWKRASMSCLRRRKAFSIFMTRQGRLGHEEIGLGIASLLENHTKKMGRKKRLGKMTGPTTDHNGD